MLTIYSKIQLPSVRVLFYLAACFALLAPSAHALELVSSDMLTQDDKPWVTEVELLAASGGAGVLVQMNEHISLRAWDTGEVLREFTLPGERMQAFDVSWDHSLLLVMDRNRTRTKRTASVWSLETGDQIAELPNADWTAAKFTPDGESFLFNFLIPNPDPTSLGYPTPDGLGAFNIASGHTTRLDARATTITNITFEQNGRFFYSAGRTAGNDELVVFEKFETATFEKVAEATVSIEGGFGKLHHIQDDLIFIGLDRVFELEDSLVANAREIVFQDLDSGLRNVWPRPQILSDPYGFFFPIGEQFFRFDLQNRELLETGTRELNFVAAIASPDGYRLATISKNFMSRQFLEFWTVSPDAPDLVAIASSPAAELYDLARLIEEQDDAALAELVTPELLNSPVARPLIHTAAAYGTFDSLLLLIANGADINWALPEQNRTPVMSAVANGNAETAELLLNLGASTGTIGVEGETFVSLLLKSPIDGSTDMGIARLKAQLQDAFSPDILNQQLLATAAIGDEQMVATLLSLGANANASGKGGMTALMAAALSQAEGADAVVARLLQTNGIDPDARNDLGSSALHLAMAQRAQPNVLSLLIRESDLEGGADGPTAWDVAKATGNATALSRLPKDKWRPPNTRLPAIPSVRVRLSSDMTKDQIRSAQEVLQSLGLYSGVDGVWGPQSRKGLAAYFSVLFEEYHSMAEAFCTDVKSSLRSGADAYASSTERVSMSGIDWYFTSSSTDNVEVVARAGQSGITCWFGGYDNGFPDLARASVLVDGYRALLEFKNQCANDDGWARTRLYDVRERRYNVAADFGCSRKIQGEPRKPSGTFTHWRDY